MLGRGRWIALVAGLLLLLAAAAPAHAGTYTVHACHLPDGTAVGTDGWTPTAFNGNPGDTAARDECRSGRGGMIMEYVLAGGSWISGSGASWTFGIPSDLAIASVALDHVFSPTGPTYTVWEINDNGGVREACDLQSGVCARIARSVSFPAWQGRNVYLSLVCRPPQDMTCTGERGAAAVLRVAVDLRDDLGPIPGAPGGALVDGSRPLVGRVEATVPLSDRGSGVASLAAEVDGTVVATAPVDDNGGRCRTPYTFRVPCKLSAVGTVAVDTTALSDGPHSVRLIVRDASGNATAQGPYAVTVRNTPVACSTGVNGAIAAGLPRKRSLTQRRARATRIRGTAPAGAELQLISRVARRGDGFRAVGATVRAGANGRYSLPVPKGPSRSLRVGWRRAGAPDFSCSRRLTLKVRARVSMSAPRSVPAGAPRARFRGRLRGGYVPGRGKLVLLQGRQPGRGWRTFRAVRTDRRGRFSTRYRFSGARGAFRVRARVPADGTYPFAPASSRAVSVRVR